MDLKELHVSGQEYSLAKVSSDKELATAIQKVLVWHRLLEPPADGQFGRLSAHALMRFQSLLEIKEEYGKIGNETAKQLIQTHPTKLNDVKIQLKNDLASRIIEYMSGERYYISTEPGERNIIYLEGVDPDGTLNKNTPNEWNDLRTIITVSNGEPKIEYKAIATVSPGKFYTDRRMNPKGAANFVGQAKAWQVGWHGTGSTHEALRQVNPITVTRDSNADFCAIGDPTDTGIFYINQHWGYDLPMSDIGRASAGCLVGRSRNRHLEFMGWIKSDPRYLKNKKYTFYTTVIRGVDLL